MIGPQSSALPRLAIPQTLLCCYWSHHLAKTCKGTLLGHPPLNLALESFSFTLDMRKIDVIQQPGLLQDQVSFFFSHSHFLGFDLCVSSLTTSSALKKLNLQSRFCLFPCRLYYITLWTFFIGMGHFLCELFVFGTVAPMIFILAILTVASKHRVTLELPQEPSQP